MEFLPLISVAIFLPFSCAENLPKTGQLDENSELHWALEKLAILWTKYEILETGQAELNERNQRLETLVLSQRLELDKLKQENAHCQYLLEEHRGNQEEQGEETVRQKTAMMDAREEMPSQREILDKVAAPGAAISDQTLQEEAAGRQSTFLENSLTGKRSYDAGALEPVIGQMNQRLTDMGAQIEALKAQDEALAQAVGTTYIRWGHAACPDSSELVYSGITSGSHHSSSGGGANRLCLPLVPVLDGHPKPNGNGVSGIYGSEYKICDEPECNTTPACAVCRTPRAASVMIPGTNACHPGWTREYDGYIMAGYESHLGNTEYICVDSSHQYLHTNQHNDNQNVIFYTVYRCGALPCPPYVNDKIVTCVICSK